MSRCGCYVVLFLALQTASFAQAPEWTSSNGKFTIKATFVSFINGSVVLLRHDTARKIKIPLTKLSTTDQKRVMDKTGWGRVWESSDGRKVVADFKSADDKTVLLELPDGRSVKTAISQFSKTDRAYIVLRAKQAANELRAGDEIRGKVVAVYDGNTITVLYHLAEVKVRLEGIDAPEIGQASSNASKKFLSERAFDKEVTVDVTGRDKDRRVLGIVTADGKNLNEEMLRAGMAWHYIEFSDDLSLAFLEREARTQKVGLWSVPGPVPPWEWRRWGPADRKQWLAARESGSVTPKRTPPTEQLPRRRSRAITHRITANSRVHHNPIYRWYASRGTLAAVAVVLFLCGLTRLTSANRSRKNVHVMKEIVEKQRNAAS